MKYRGIVFVLIISIVIFFPLIGVNISNKAPSKNKHYFLSAEENIDKASEKDPQDKTVDKKKAQEKNNMRDDLLIKVMIIILIVWAGISVFLFRIDRRISRLEKDIEI